tara:strand:- start:108 stop:524 length:417 start_codon:yes stop_codon:yes gene_type:complete
MEPMIFSEGFMQTTVNNQIMDTKQYKATYNGKNGNMIFKDNDRIFLIKADDKDLENILAGSRDLKIDDELMKLKDKHYTPKNKTRRKRKKKIRKKKTPTRKRKTPTKKGKTPTRKRKTPTKRKTKKSLLDQDFLKTIL